MSKIMSGELIGKRESVVDELLLLNEHQTPLISLLGFSTPVSQTEHQWFEDEMFGYVSKLDVAITSDSTTEFTVEDGSIFRKDHVVKVDDELMKVTDVATNTLTVERGYADTDKENHADEAVIEILFVEGEEGADARDARHKARSKISNYTQIFDETIKISGTASVVSNYGIDDLYEHEKAKKLLELALQLEKALINGVKYENSNVRLMKGIREFVSANVTDASNDELDDGKINDAMQDIYEQGGFEQGGNWKIMTPAKQKRVISKFDQSNIRLTREENTRGQVVDFYVSDFGQAEIVLNNNLKPDEIFIVDANRLAIRPLNTREFTHEYLGKKGDYYEGMIVGEYTLEMVQEKASARIRNLQ